MPLRAVVWVSLQRTYPSFVEIIPGYSFVCDTVGNDASLKLCFNLFAVGTKKNGRLCCIHHISSYFAKLYYFCSFACRLLGFLYKWYRMQIMVVSLAFFLILTSHVLSCLFWCSGHSALSLVLKAMLLLFPWLGWCLRRFFWLVDWFSFLICCCFKYGYSLSG